MSVAGKVYEILSSSAELTSLLVRDMKGRCIYHGRSPDAGKYPIVVYSVISDVPALAADGQEVERRVTVRIHILTKDGNYEKIYRALQKDMLAAGFLRYATEEFAEKDLFIKMADYRTGIGVEE